MTAVRTVHGMFWQPCTYCRDVAVTGLDPPSGKDRPDSFEDEYREPDNASRVAALQPDEALLLPTQLRQTCDGCAQAPDWRVSWQVCPPRGHIVATVHSSYAAYRASAQYRSYLWSSTEEQFYKHTAANCCDCGAPGTSTIDRIDNGPINADDKVQAFCYHCNMTKCDDEAR
jgi:hypothetical protein